MAAHPQAEQLFRDHRLVAERVVQIAPNAGVGPENTCAQEEGTAGIEQDEEVTNMTLAMFYFYIPNFQLKQGYFSSFQSQ